MWYAKENIYSRSFTCRIIQEIPYLLCFASLEYVITNCFETNVCNQYMKKAMSWRYGSNVSQERGQDVARAGFTRRCLGLARSETDSNIQERRGSHPSSENRHLYWFLIYLYCAGNPKTFPTSIQVNIADKQSNSSAPRPPPFGAGSWVGPNTRLNDVNTRLFGNHDNGNAKTVVKRR